MSTLRAWDDRTGLPLLASRLVVGGVLLVLGWTKVADPVTFLKLIREYELVPEDLPWVLNTMAVGLPWIELVAGACLVLGVFLRGAFGVALLMLATFTAAVALRTLGIQASEGVPLCSIAFDCGCGSGEVIACRKVLENVGLIVLCGVGLWSRSTRLCLRRDLLG